MSAVISVSGLDAGSVRDGGLARFAIRSADVSVWSGFGPFHAVPGLYLVRQQAFIRRGVAALRN